MDVTARLGLPLLTAGQAQKEVFHNEALQAIDCCLAPSVAGLAQAAPPTGPVAGDCYLVAAGATGAWVGHADALAFYVEGGWRFVAAREGLRVWVSSMGVDATFRAGSWEIGALRASKLVVGSVQVVGAQQAAITAPAAGTTVDGEARAVIGQMLVALRGHGLIAP